MKTSGEIVAHAVKRRHNAEIGLGLVYYAADVTRWGTHIKIGHTQDLRQRIRQLGPQYTSSGQRPILVALEEGGLAVERERHQQFRAEHAYGEWFHPVGALADYLITLDKPDDFLRTHRHLWPCAQGWGPVPFLSSGLTSTRTTSVRRSTSDPEGTDHDEGHLRRPAPLRVVPLPRRQAQPRNCGADGRGPARQGAFGGEEGGIERP